MARIVEAMGRVGSGRLSCVDAAEQLGMSERHFRRLRAAYVEGGAEAVVDRRRGRLASNRAPEAVAEWVVEQYLTRYFDFTPKHFHEELAKRGFGYGYTWTKSVLYSRGVLKPSVKRGTHRKKRERRPLPGMMLFQDGSTHAWLAGSPPLDLIVTLDDATSEITSVFLCEQEGTASSFRGLHETITALGLFGSLYTDRGSHYWLTPKAGGKVSREDLTQVGRALAQLGIEHIASYAPEARGRMERVFGTLQNRLPPALRLAGITDVDAANGWLQEVYRHEHNARFAVPAAEAGTAYVPFVGDLDNVLCVQDERTVGNDNCVRHGRRSLQIPEQAHRRHYVRAAVRVNTYPDGSRAVFHGPRRLARYDATGALLDAEAPLRSAA